MNQKELNRIYQKEKVGERNINSDGSWMTITNYRTNQDIDVIFDTGYKVEHIHYESFKNGFIKDRLYPTFYNEGYVGVGDYPLGRISKSYNIWCHILERCYGEKNGVHQRSYVGCEISEEWKNYQNFAKWYEENYYEIPDEKMCVDKDLLVKGNKIYSSQTCCILPNKINVAMVTGHNNKREGSSSKEGVWVAKDQLRNKKYVSYSYSIDGKRIMKRFSTEDEAYDYYVASKEKRIKELADYYIKYLPEYVYKALYNYSARK